MLQKYSQEILATQAVGGFIASFPIALVNEYLQAIALVVSIVSGIIVAYRHFRSKKVKD